MEDMFVTVTDISYGVCGDKATSLTETRCIDYHRTGRVAT